ncbi:tetraacyldisaccharide 4'-kinase [Arcobacter porcinus]|uniref:Tetraacyldisaccharide 4'-kinase n=1 Tax=Arcobacter porcinus TaxID=1935204 RepID=A0A5C2HHH7_9BACT|nr:tetraacyldisaccharide 4'-kinase [Arcobacter porcinus]OCL82765.1 Tetraacyldisaccharide 4'-kinase [Arcobacter porcinus]OCL92421.1 Tetraacyldisaccharide 4'-kinase [Aliarcobacter thereius]QEP40552.1 tetraacyldisaccharide 4'-kinase [Arcobacter porcinus]
MKQKLILWFENYLFYPNSFQKLISFLLLPLSFIYIIVILSKRLFAKKNDFSLPIISVGNLIVGGSGKTPITIKLASNYKDVFIILRGYGRESKGLFLVSQNGNILVDVKTSGDEAMLLAKSLKNASVIVSEDRVLGINKAKELGAKIIFLDDAFSKYSIKKFDILLKAKNEPENSFCIPSGAYREPKYFYKKADLILKEGIDFKRVVTIKNAIDDSLLNNSKTTLLTAISKPKRLLEFLGKDTKMIAFADHHNFTKEELVKIIEENKSSKIITTLKDFVKIKEFEKEIDLSDFYLMHLEIEFTNESIFNTINGYIKEFE